MKVKKVYVVNKNKKMAFEEACKVNGIQLEVNQQRKKPIRIINQRGTVVEVNDAGEVLGTRKSTQAALRRQKKPGVIQKRKRATSPFSSEEVHIDLDATLPNGTVYERAITNRKKSKRVTIKKRKKY